MNAAEDILHARSDDAVTTQNMSVALAVVNQSVFKALRPNRAIKGPHRCIPVLTRTYIICLVKAVQVCI